MKFIHILILLSFGVLFYAKLCTTTSANLHWAVVFTPLIYWISVAVGQAVYESYKEWDAQRPRRPNWLK